VQTGHTSIEITGRSTVSCIARPTAEEIVDAPGGPGWTVRPQHRVHPAVTDGALGRRDRGTGRSLAQDTVVATALSINDC